MKNSLNFDYSSYDLSDSYDKTYFFLNNYLGESNFIKQLLIDSGKNISESSFLDFGCGTGNLISFLPEFNLCCGVDISKNMINLALDKHIQNALFVKSDLCDFKSEKKFDLILISTYILQTFSSIQDIVNFISDVTLLLNDGGLILFSWIDESKYISLNPTEDFSFKLDDVWVCHGKTKKLSSNKRNFKLEFLNKLNGSTISSEATYLDLSEDLLTDLFNSKITFYSGKQFGLNEDYQKWAVLRF